MHIVLAAVPFLNTRVPPLSIALLAGELKAHGKSVTCFDFNIDAYSRVDEELKECWKLSHGYKWSDEKYFSTVLYPKIIHKLLDEWSEKIIAESPDIVGISITPSPVGPLLAKEIKKKKSSIKIIVGGPSCSQAYTDHAYVPSEDIDAVVSGEGEQALLELVNCLEENGEFKVMPSVYVAQNGRIIFGGNRTPIHDLDSLAFPDFSEFNLYLYKDADKPVVNSIRPYELPLYSSRGCVGRCNFCMDYKIWGKSYRQKSPKRVVQEMEYFLKEYNVKQFMFVELAMNGNHRWLEEFSDACCRKNLGVNFWGLGRIDEQLTPQLLRKLRDAGLFHLNFGLESGSVKVLQKMGKHYSIQTAGRCIKDVYASGITIDINLIVGFPGETLVDFFKTIFFVFKYRKYIYNSPNLQECHATAGTDLYLYPERFNIKINYRDDSYFSSWESLDDKNAHSTRSARKNLMHKVFSFMKFQSSCGRKKE